MTRRIVDSCLRNLGYGHFPALILSFVKFRSNVTNLQPFFRSFLTISPALVFPFLSQSTDSLSSPHERPRLITVKSKFLPVVRVFSLAMVTRVSRWTSLGRKRGHKTTNSGGICNPTVGTLNSGLIEPDSNGRLRRGNSFAARVDAPRIVRRRNKISPEKFARLMKSREYGCNIRLFRKLCPWETLSDSLDWQQSDNRTMMELCNSSDRTE